MGAELDLHDVAFDHPKAMRELQELREAARLAAAIDALDAWRLEGHYRFGNHRFVDICGYTNGQDAEVTLEVGDEPVCIRTAPTLRDAILAAGDWIAAGEGV